MDAVSDRGGSFAAAFPAAPAATPPLGAVPLQLLQQPGGFSAAGLLARGSNMRHVRLR